MKITFFLVFTLAIVLSCSDTKEKKPAIRYSDLSATNFKGAISAIKMTYYTCDSTGKIGDMQDCCITVQNYNEAGNNYKQINTNKEGVIVEEETKEFYDNGLIKKQITVRNGKIVRTIEATLNDSGKYATLTFLDSAGKVQMYLTDMIMNEFAQPVSFNQYDKDSSFVMKEESKYDGNKLLSYFQTDQDGKLIARYENKYNDKGECIESIVIQPTETGAQRSVTKYTYDEYDIKGNCIKRTQWHDTGKALGIIKMEFSYR